MSVGTYEPIIALPDLEEAERLRDIERREEAQLRRSIEATMADYNRQYHRENEMSFARVKDAIRRRLHEVEMWSELYAYYFDGLTQMILIEREWK